MNATNMRFKKTFSQNPRTPSTIFKPQNFDFKIQKKYGKPKCENLRKRHLTKVSIFVKCTKIQLIQFQNFNIQTYFSQFLWFFSLKC